MLRDVCNCLQTSGLYSTEWCHEPQKAGAPEATHGLIFCRAEALLILLRCKMDCWKGLPKGLICSQDRWDGSVPLSVLLTGLLGRALWLCRWKVRKALL